MCFCGKGDAYGCKQLAKLDAQGTPQLPPKVAKAIGATLQIVGGSVEMVAAVPTAAACETGVGCVAAYYLIASGADNLAAGGKNLYYLAFDGDGHPMEPTAGAQAISRITGMSIQNAEVAYAITQVGAAGTVAWKAGVVVKPANGQTSTIDSSKFDYLFGNSTSNAHNAARSNQLALEMKTLGISNDAKGQQILTEHFNSVVKTNGNVTNTFSNSYGEYEVRQSLLMGPSGKSTLLDTTFQVMPDGSRRFVTTITKSGRTK